MKKENRFYVFQDARLGIEKREDGTASRKVIGYAAVFEKWSRNFGPWFREKISRDAFAATDMSDAVALFNHDSNQLLARNGKTLTLSVDEIGLRYEFEAPNTTAGNDLLESISRGDVSGSSFSFTIEEDTWNESETEEVEEDRTITKIGRLFDVGPVTYPAYPDTIVAGAKRNYETERLAQREAKKEIPVEVYEQELKLQKLK